MSTPTISRRRLLTWLGAAAGAGGFASALAACSASSSPSSSRSAVPADALDVRHFGARGNGTTDDTAAITRALKALRPGQTLVFPPGRYPHSQVVIVSTPGVTLRGPGELFATAEESSALQIDAPDVSVEHMTVAMGRTTQRWSSDDQHKIFLAPHAGITIRDVHVQGSAAAGLFSYGASNFEFTDVRVSDTRADGIHMTNGSNHGVLRSPQIARSGDDGVAVVSYLEDSGPCHHIVVHEPTVHTTTGGRGVSVVGGHDVEYYDVDVDRSDAASVYLACESGDFTTHDTERVTVQGGKVTNANTDAAIDHGAVLVYSGRAGGSVSHVVVEGLAISGTRASASRQIGAIADSSADALSDVVFRDLQLAASPTPYQGNAPISDISMQDVTAAGATVRATQ